jgi:hypothetical protein
MKKLLILIVLGFGIYAAWKHVSVSGASGSAVPENPVYAEFRVKYPDDIELVGLGRMDSLEDCETRADMFWRGVLASGAQAEMSSVKCVTQLPTRFQALFENKTAYATYIAMDRGNSGERDGRFLFYGVPSSEVMKHCPALIDSIKKRFSGEVKCIQGSVG